MKRTTFSFSADLLFFLRAHQPEPLTLEFDWRGSIKDMIESLGVPHAEIELILVNEQPVNFEYIVQDADRIAVYGRDYPAHRANGFCLRPPLDARPRFVLDTHLGRLAAYLRMLGFDSLYRNDYADDELARISHDETRILLTRDVGLLKRSLVIYGYYVRAIKPQQRLLEVTQRYDLLDQMMPFKHCMKCNGRLLPVAKDLVRDQLPDGTAQYYQDFHQCQSCGRVFWPGAHYQRMQTLLDVVRDAVNGQRPA